MKTPEQIAAETAEKIFSDGLSSNAKILLEGSPESALKECANDYILAALTGHAAQTQAELTALRAVADDLEDALLTCSPMADYPSEEWTRLSEKRISALTSYTKLRIGEKGAV